LKKKRLIKTSFYREVFIFLEKITFGFDKTIVRKGIDFKKNIGYNDIVSY